jgi:hypothetical protein
MFVVVHRKVVVEGRAAHCREIIENECEMRVGSKACYSSDIVWLCGVSIQWQLAMCNNGISVVGSTAVLAAIHTEGKHTCHYQINCIIK